MSTYKTEIKAVIRPLFIGFIIIWNLVLFYYLVQNPYQETYLTFIILGLLSIAVAVRQLFARLEINISETDLILKYRIFSLPFMTKTYCITEIKQLEKEYNVNEYSGYGKSNWLTHKTPVIITFIYRNKRVKVGKTFSWTNIDETIEELKTKQKI